jgi:hypothetical protein
MEEAVANCPDLFIEPGLQLVRRQVVIIGRRPDILFSDALSRHLLVEIQCGRLDEDHLQRHFHYYFDYRAKYPSTHLRLMFIANRLVPQHKDFLDEHGYEFREIGETDFERRLAECRERTNEPHKRKESERFHVFGYDELIKRNKVSLDFSWLKDDSLEDPANLPDPDVIAAAIAEDSAGDVGPVRADCGGAKEGATEIVSA